jgi:small subunit ribosomal protein S6
MRQYELVVLLHPDLEIDVDTPIAKIEKLVEAASGKVVKRDNWGKKRLAYKVAKQEFAVYVYFELSLEPTQVAGLDNALRLTEEVLRHILVAQEVAVPKPDKKPKKVKEPVAAGEEK